MLPQRKIGERKEMKIARNKTAALPVIIVLMLATSAAMICLPIGNALTSITVTTRVHDIIGQNSATRIVWTLTPNILDTNPNYNSSATVWANATITFTRPDGTKDVLNGPFTRDPQVIGGSAPRLALVYTPNMMGNWTVRLYWPGDSTYAAINKTDAFTVGGYFPRRPSFAQLSLRPYPTIGLGQQLLVNAWVSPPPWTSLENYKGYVFTFTSPSGQSFTVGPMDSEGEGTVWFNLPLTELGNWSIKFEFPGDYGTMPCSVTRYINVQNDWTPSYPDTPLPTEPWTFPINIENRNWRTIAGPWYQSYYNASEGAWNPYTEAPRTPHILWMLPAYSGTGGFVGSPHSIETGSGNAEYEAGDAGIYSSSTYSISCIMDGRAYSSSGGNITCFDIRTGQTLWSVPGSFNAGAERSRVPTLYSFGTNFIAYNAITGAVTLNVTGLSMTFFDDPYVYSSSGNYLIKWTVGGTSTNFTTRIIWNVTNPLSTFGTSVTAIQNNLLVTKGRLADASIIELYMEAVNCTTGALEYRTKVIDTTDPSTWVYRQGPATGSGYGLVFYAGIPTQNQGLGYTAFDASTGKLAWNSEKTDYPWGLFWAYMPEACGYGMVYGFGYTGVYAFNATNGKIVWHYIDKDTYNEEPYASDIAPDGSTYASYSFGSVGPAIGGGIVFAPNTEHSPTFYYRGQGLNAIDAYTGQKLWKILGIYSPSAIAEGVLTASDSVNGYTYGFAKGETSTTVATSAEVIAKGDSVLLKGTVLDMSPAQNGTAAVSDADQEAWMEYLHMQQPYPTSAKGVKVSLDALDPNNNFVHIGDATTDLTGQYRFGWTPEIEGTYTVVASFYSTGAYYGSTAETGILVTPAAATPTPPPAAPVPPDYTMTIIGVGIAMLIGLAVATLLIIRKRP